jgi:hypothetical protein
MVNAFLLLVPEDLSLKSFAGFIAVKGQEYPLRIRTPAGRDNLRDASLDLGAPLSRQLLPWATQIQNELRTAPNLDAFLTDFKELLERVLDAQQHTALPHGPFYSHLMSELSNVGWDNVISLSNDLTKLSLSIKDSRHRRHVLEVLVPHNFPACPAQGQLQLPQTDLDR